MDAPGFVHLRVHTEYSISDSIVRIDALVEAALADHQPAVAVTDLANLFGWVKFYKAARAKGVQPICGADLWISNETDRERPFRLLVLVENQQGYLSLCRLLSRAWLENEHRGRGEIKKSWFAERDGQGQRYSHGLIALSGGIEGEIGQALLAGRSQQAKELAKSWATLFDENSFFLEVWRRDDDADEKFVRDSAHLALALDLPLVATHP
ncbi:MAG: PHP domain-containing protein, partial [Proteobacteria bacterium]|nr:PHP domain-containing protein [Pseudomonadota bacterium]